MEKLIKFVASITGKRSSSVSRLFSSKSSGGERPLDDQFYSGFARDVATRPELYLKEFQESTACGLQQPVILRVLLLWHYTTRLQEPQGCFIRQLELQSVSKSKSTRVIPTQMLVDSYREYLSRLSVLQVLDSSGWSPNDWVRAVTQLVKLMGLSFQIEANLEIEWQRFKGETTLPLISHRIICDCQQFLRILYEFIDRFSPLILQKHPDSETIYGLYQQILHINRQSQRRLTRINASQLELPALKVDKEMNRRIELEMFGRGRPPVREPRRLSTSIDVVYQTEDEIIIREETEQDSHRPFTTKGW